MILIQIAAAHVRVVLLSTIFTLFCSVIVSGQARYKVLIIDGQNDHKNWQQTTQLMKSYLEETKLFTVDVMSNTPSEGRTLDSFKPDFTKYNAVLSNYNGREWPQNIKKAFEGFVSNGGGLVIVHAADNAFPEWLEYNKMIGVGGGNGRDEKSGPSIYYDETKDKVELNTSPGPAGSHGAEYQFKVNIRAKNHPVTNGLPKTWMHEMDGIYNQLRGPAQNIEVLATVKSDRNQKGSDREEPVIMAINYGRGKVFHTTLGHGIDGQQGVGFITILQRGTEWVATGKVTQKIPSDFPGEEKGSKRVR